MQTDFMVIGHFRYVDDTKAAIVRLKELGHTDFELYSPVPNHDLEDEIYRGKKRSPVRRITLLGGLTGVCSAFLMTIWMSRDWPLRTSAKPVVSIPPFVVIGFECTILLGGIFTLLALLHWCRLPNLFGVAAYRPNFSKHIFGLTIRASKEGADALKEIFSKCGAEEVEVQYVR